MRVPKFQLEEIEDYYVYYVCILRISEELFWNADISFIRGVVEDKSAYDNWRSYVRQQLEKERRH